LAADKQTKVIQTIVNYHYERVQSTQDNIHMYDQARDSPIMFSELSKLITFVLYTQTHQLKCSISFNYYSC